MEKQKIKGRLIDTRIISAAQQLGLEIRPNETIREGDLYLAVRNRPTAKLLECKYVDNKLGCVVPTDPVEYQFYRGECVKVTEKEKVS